ncbi:MAG: Rrf2 family transcriptional regulator [Candidatus Obscuribacter sp.]|jgi:Rrf2 family nitric oxide-sensitive transcriptional repressor|nr:Rrf2 family transcriptional regulator [Candidatus Obscuribacter sp.]MDQ5965320.1 Rrf2 family transcriptional regulator, nitric oxide-sensitive transcriptional repressor [Cyanobacteriota bacterium erpe_2018_sw_39hr_WHONDRS-SW48-000098_B_bin.30]MBK7839685.1 Rrf2 family transcriptional regulator [Candidatus Obscuribacter sp.]MBK9618823.1 Rrf2 family transcriptional regulator [Candidatus Obscuribacter sp.]MBK9769768.1 Rrf2 family transcriptional regulator [Candidatus Obscuribacter sp.]
MISQTSEYALRAMVFLAMRESAATGQEIAEVTRVPAGYLSKIMQQLVKAKLVGSQRGIGGGFHLLKTPGEISILDVVNSVDPIEQLTSCPLGIESHGFTLCPLHHRLSEATAQLERAFAESYLSELVQESKNPLCASVPLTSRDDCSIEQP